MELEIVYIFKKRHCINVMLIICSHKLFIHVGQGVELKDILPNTDKVSSIIEELFGGSAAELLATSINPILVRLHFNL